MPKEPTVEERKAQIKAEQKDAKANEPKFKDFKKWIVWDAREQVLAGGPFETEEDAENAGQRYAEKRNSGLYAVDSDFRAVEVPHSRRV